MDLSRIFPRVPGSGDADCAGIFTALVMTAHFERSRARALGWRGVRPSGGTPPAWTCRVAGEDCVFGIRFDGEYMDADGTAPPPEHTRTLLRGAEKTLAGTEHDGDSFSSGSVRGGSALSGSALSGSALSSSARGGSAASPCPASPGPTPSPCPPPGGPASPGPAHSSDGPPSSDAPSPATPIWGGVGRHCRGGIIPPTGSLPSPSSSAFPAGCLRGYFSLYLFPPAGSPFLERFLLSALRAALLPGYGEAVRNFSGREGEFAPFLLGRLRLDVSPAGDALGLTLTAPARRRVFSAEGIRAGDGWLVPPGGAECDVPAFSRFLRLFSVLAATIGQQLGEEPVVTRGARLTPALCWGADGEIAEDARAADVMLSITASFGPSMAFAGEAEQRLPRLPAFGAGREASGRKLPALHVLTGFLGAGKTTFLRRWLDFLHGRERYTGVIQNEFGRVQLDAALMRGEAVVEALDEGCVCCSLADSLRPGLERIIRALPAEQFILETTGLANPDNIAAALDDLRDLVVPGLFITVADAIALCGEGGAGNGAGDKTARGRGEAEGGAGGEEPAGGADFPAGGAGGAIRRAQFTRADVIIVNKSDAVSAGALAALCARLRAINPKALVIPACYGTIAFAELDAWADAHAAGRLPSRAIRLSPLPRTIGTATAGTHTVGAAGAESRAAGGRAPTHADDGYEAKTLEFSGPVALADLKALLEGAGRNLCRAKGIIEIAGEGPCVVQYAAGRLEITPAPREKPLDLVLIGTNLNV